MLPFVIDTTLTARYSTPILSYPPINCAATTITTYDINLNPITVEGCSLTDSNCVCETGADGQTYCVDVDDDTAYCSNCQGNSGCSEGLACILSGCYPDAVPTNSNECVPTTDCGSGLNGGPPAVTIGYSRKRRAYNWLAT